MKQRNSYMRWSVLFAIILLGFVGISFWPEASQDQDLPAKVDFNYHIRPILSQNCFVCHGPDSTTREANLRLDNFEGATSLLGEGGAAIVPGKIHKSLLVDRISSTDPDFMMPPPESKKQLSARDIALLKRWIKQGAKWKPHWAFIPPQSPDLPTNMSKDNTTQVIDHLIDKKIKSQHLRPSPQASKNVLIRRVSYLMTGLPPTPESVNSFITDSSPEAYEKMIDQYLSSPHYGERWARHWMDLVRYGESMGHEGDFNISNPWEYRDYLIRAFNEDVPYDLFVKEHLAGDMLENPRYHPVEDFNESMIGTGYFFLGEGKHSPVNPKLEEADKIDNMIDVTAKTFQALTVACARCHDHKFDPIPTTDYYAMYGMIESSRLGPQPARRTRLQETQFEKLKGIKKEIRAQLAQQMLPSVSQPSAQFIKQQKQFINTLEKSEEQPKNCKIIGDFRSGNWEGWYSEGWAFGDGPLMGEPVFDRETATLTGLKSGMASSRVYGPGIHGALRSQNFIIEHDKIAVRARGRNGLIRVIIDNFQVIQGPLWDKLEFITDDANWKTYILDVNLAKGHKAYLQFTPGHYSQIKKHIYQIHPEDYIEVEYAFGFDGELPELPPPDLKDGLPLPPEAKKQALADWANEKTSPDQLPFIQNALKNSQLAKAGGAIPALVSRYDSLARQLYDSTHFIGLTEGDAIYSPVFIRGSVNEMGDEKVSHRFLSAIQAGPDSFPQQGSGRLAWAESVVDPSNPLSSRVMVNRIWHHVFGRGIVETVDNFGLQGKPPSHPALLDYLALRFVEEGWSVKRMLKSILMSQVFQRSTEVIADNQTIDPKNLMLHHFPIRRLEAEAIRDGVLAVSGSLDLSMYGAPVPVHLTEFMTGRGRPRFSGPLDGNGRRSIYISVRRNFIPPMMLVFDMPIPFSTFGRRNTTNVPAQSLTLLNDPFVHDQANKWGESLLGKRGDTLDETIEIRVKDIYWRAFSREPSTEELTQAKTFLENQAQHYGCHLEEAGSDLQLWADYCHLVFNFKEFIHLL